jgi:hypothetical protein
VSASCQEAHPSRGPAHDTYTHAASCHRRGCQRARRATVAAGAPPGVVGVLAQVVHKHNVGTIHALPFVECHSLTSCPCVGHGSRAAREALKTTGQGRETEGLDVRIRGIRR